MAARPRRLTLTRRGLLAASGLAGLAAGCGEATPRSRSGDRDASPRRIRYGDEHGSQYAELRLPEATPTSTVVLLHGGYWLPGYGLQLMDPLAERLTALGHATWNVEYRRVQGGGGVPTTLADVAAAIEHLTATGMPSGLEEKVVLLGHSAGGQLAAWAASRTAKTPGGAARVPLQGVISLSGVLNLTLAARRPGSTSQVTGFVGGTPARAPENYALADPTLLVPPTSPVWSVHAHDDQVVPAEQSTTYVTAAKAAGGTAEHVDVPGDHFTLIDPGAPSFATIRALLDRAAG